MDEVNEERATSSQPVTSSQPAVVTPQTTTPVRHREIPTPAMQVWDQLREIDREDIRNGLMTTRSIEIVPDLGLIWAGSSPDNRPRKDYLIEAYRRYIVKGLWVLTHQGMAFDTNWFLIDGQHRCWAIYYAGVPVTAQVTFNADPASQRWCDTGANRTNNDRLHLLPGMDWITTRATALFTMVGMGINGSKPQLDDLVNSVTAYEDGVKFVLNCTSSYKKGLCRTPVLAPVVRAYYRGYSQQRLREFLTVICTGEGNGPQDSGAVRLGRYILECLQRAGGAEEGALYWMTEAALIAFLEKRHVKILRATNEEMFPLARLGSLVKNRK